MFGLIQVVTDCFVFLTSLGLLVCLGEGNSTSDLNEGFVGGGLSYNNGLFSVSFPALDFSEFELAELVLSSLLSITVLVSESAQDS